MPRIKKNELLRLQKVLKTDTEIGNKFGITRQAIHQLRQLYGIPALASKNDARNEKIVALYKKGLTGIEIAKKMGLCNSQTYRIIHKAEKGTKQKRKSA